MKILLFGSTGQVGWELQRSLAPLGEVITQRGEFAQPDTLAALVADTAPDVIVNAAAYTDVDRAEAEHELAEAINYLAPGALAQAAAACGALIVHYSTDYVFDGSGHKPLTEKDPTGPLSAYGRSKLKGERAVARNCPRHLILRTGWVYGLHGRNFAKAILRAATTQERLQVVEDQHGAPTGADLIADITAHAIARTLAQPALAGLYHLAAASETTRNGYARFLIGEALAAGWELAAAAERVERIPTSARPAPAKRPRNTRLDCSKLRNAFGLNLPAWQQGVTRLVRELKPGGPVVTHAPVRAP